MTRKAGESMVAAGSLLLVHGAGSGPGIFEEWLDDFPGRKVVAPDLQAGLDPAVAGMADYAAAVHRAGAVLERPLALIGWSMGGLVAMMAARQLEPARLVLIEASPPAEVQGYRPDIEVPHGTYDPGEAYGQSALAGRARPESLQARAERKRGISVPTLPCPTAVVYGDDFPEIRGRAVARRYGASELPFPGLGHADLVRSAAVRAVLRSWLAAPLGSPPAER